MYTHIDIYTVVFLEIQHSSPAYTHTQRNLHTHIYSGTFGDSAYFFKCYIHIYTDTLTYTHKNGTPGDSTYFSKFYTNIHAHAGTNTYIHRDILSEIQHTLS